MEDEYIKKSELAQYLIENLTITGWGNLRTGYVVELNIEGHFIGQAELNDNDY